VFDAAGNLYTANFCEHTISKLGSTGSDLGTLSAFTGSPQTELDQPTGLALDSSGNLYAADYGNNTVHKFSPAGGDQGIFASAGLDLPEGLAFDAAGNLYVANCRGSTIHKFGPTGADLGVFASTAFSTTGLDCPVGMVFDDNGNLYVANLYDNSIYKFDWTGRLLGTFANVGMNSPTFMVIYPPHAPTLAGCPANITVKTGSGRATCDQVVTWTAPTATDNCGAVPVTSDYHPGDTFPVGTTTVTYTATDASGNSSHCSFTVTVVDTTPPVIAPVVSQKLYVSSLTGHTIIDFDTASGSQSTFAAPVPYPLGLAFDSSGNLYVAEASPPIIHKFGPTGNDLGVFASGVDGASGLAFDASGNLYVAKGDGTIHEYGPTGADLGVFASTGLDNSGLAFDTRGNLYVSNYGNSTVHRFSPTGTDLGIFADTADGGQLGGLAFDADGNLYVANWSHNKVHRFSPTGASLGVFASAGLHYPFGLTFDSVGNLYVATRDDNSIHKFSATAADLGILPSTGLSFPMFLAFPPAEGAVPTPACAGNIVVGTGPGRTTCDQVVDWTPPTPQDTCHGTVSLTSDYHPGDTFPVGVSTVTYTATDSAGNWSKCSFTVTVVDTTPPVPDVATLPTLSDPHSVTVTAQPTATDNCAGAIIGTTVDPLTYSSVGTHTVHWVYDDGHGNQTVQTQTVTILPTPPSISSQPQNTTVALGAGATFTVIASGAGLGRHSTHHLGGERCHDGGECCEHGRLHRRRCRNAAGEPGRDSVSIR
jgi:sugar lactone lactonase YvrE